MISDERKPIVPQIYEDAMKNPKCKETIRLEIEANIREFLRKKGKVVELAPSTERAETLRF